MLNIFIVVLILNIIAIFYFIFPPRKANYIYGYRTSKTLQNNKVFKYANKHASRYLLILSVINTVLNTILAFSKLTGINFAILTTISTIIISVVLTEIKLNQYSDES